jgi:hypothetical protein
MAGWRVLLRVLRERFGRWIALSFALGCGYYAALLGAMMLRFLVIPNYGHLYDAPEAYHTIWVSTPSTRDALEIMADEPLFELGYAMPEFGIAEWSLTVTLPNLLRVAGISALLACFALLVAASRRAGCRTSRRSAAAASGGAGLLALCSASLTWVVCCATPSWIVALSILGVSLAVADAVEPFEHALLALGLAATVAGIALQARQLARDASPASRLAPASAPLRAVERKLA